MKAFEQVINIKDKLKGVSAKLGMNQIFTIGMGKKLYEELINNPVDSRPYKVYTALLTQQDIVGEVPPQVTILENTLGNIEWIYESTGCYRAILPGVFLEDKTYFSITTSFYSLLPAGGHTLLPLLITRLDNDSIEVQSFYQIDPFEGRDGALYFTPIEIRVYN